MSGHNTLTTYSKFNIFCIGTLKFIEKKMIWSMKLKMYIHCYLKIKIINNDIDVKIMKKIWFVIYIYIFNYAYYIVKKLLLF